MSERRSGLIGDSDAMRRVRHLIGQVGPRHSTVLIRGESGTGKELVARALHDASPRCARPFVPVDCTTLRDSLFESQLFGHARGAFTGAHKETLGFIRAADGGTLFLDEVGELEPANQARLLRFLQESTVTPVGTVKPIPVNVRVVAATHRDLGAMVDRGDFRLDLFFRLNVVRIETPPLRRRRGDIPALVEHYLRKLARLYDEPARSLTGEALDALCAADWRGNVRELVNAVEHMYVMSDDPVIDTDGLPETLRGRASDTPSADVSVERCGASGIGLVPMETAQRRLVERALTKTEGHQGRAAELLQVERRRFYRMVQRFDLRHLTRS